MVPPDRFADPSWVGRALDNNGFSPGQRQASVSIFTKLAQRLKEQPKASSGDERTAYGFFVPGRIEVIGKHTDYAGGSSLVCAVDRGFHVIAEPGDDSSLTLIDAYRGLQGQFDIAPSLSNAVTDWTLYPRTVAGRLARNFPGATRGGTLVFHNNLPAASGMSSSSAFVISCYLVLKAFNDLPSHPVFQQVIVDALAEAHYCGCIENGPDFGSLKGDTGVGTFGGCQDQIAILCSYAQHLSHFSYAPALRCGTYPLPADHRFVIGASGTTADKTGEAQDLYNNVSRLARELARLASVHTGLEHEHLGAYARGDGNTLNQLLGFIETGTTSFAPTKLAERALQFFEETQILIPGVVRALQKDDLKVFGDCIRTSHGLADAWLHNQIPETNTLVNLAYERGATAASAFGAGFGGAVYALVPEARAKPFMQKWASAYRKAFPQHTRADFFSVEAGPPAFMLG